MGGARALIASLGASFSLVAGAAVSLLVVSFVFAYDGFTGGVDVAPAAGAVVLEADAAQATRSGGKARRNTAAVVISPQAPAPRATEQSRPVSRPARTSERRPTRTQPEFNPGVRDLNPVAPRTDPAPPVGEPAPGDGVRDVGDAVSAAVQDTGKSAGAATAQLLGPPVSQAVQAVLDLLASALQGATGALAGALDKSVPR